VHLFVFIVFLYVLFNTFVQTNKLVFLNNCNSMSFNCNFHFITLHKIYGMKSILVFLALGVVFVSCKNNGMDFPRVSSGSIERIENFQSNYVDSRNIDVWLPAGYSAEKKYAVLYMHDGQMLFDSAITWNKQEWKVDEVISELIIQQEIKECIVVGIWNNGNYRHSEYFPQGVVNYLPNNHEEITNKRLMNKLQADNYLKFVVNELKPLIDKKYSTIPSQNATYMGGSSMGGLISLYAVCEYPEVFGGALCISTHWPMANADDKELSEMLADSFRNYLIDKLPNADKHLIYFDFGTETLDVYYEPYQILVDEIMIEKGYDNSNWLTLKFDGHDHSERSWTKRLNIPLKFILKK